MTITNNRERPGITLELGEKDEMGDSSVLVKRLASKNVCVYVEWDHSHSM